MMNFAELKIFIMGDHSDCNLKCIYSVYLEDASVIMLFRSNLNCLSGFSSFYEARQGDQKKIYAVFSRSNGAPAPLSPLDVEG